ncbi:conserved Plasmodium protein, unknown function [Plasmodium ovale]|uniref:Uncharacterized protein n=2 Tax=Plasmodium ovale TaxID=36330 RepID=A0A1A8VX53_PLAOA|nr:conserved Plasmodium protein, unknown function [Plasmodium ovale curtisi]SBS92510.1 conserved Plasmodium protein, unknown function [Plasmodium ovale curtisi]SCQ16446.1 conserved Plasmodium protein, unknown function [Plasmodium ovale]
MGKSSNKNKKSIHNNVANTKLNNKPSLKWRLINKEANFFDKAFEENLLNFQKMSLNEDDYSSQKEDTIEEKISRCKKLKKKKRKKKIKSRMRKRETHKQKRRKFKR